MKKKKSLLQKESFIFYFITGFMAILCFLPIWLCFVASISSETAIVKNGFSLLPQEPTLATYKFIIAQKGVMIARAFGVTLFTVAVGTVYTITIMTSFAYAIAQPKKNFRFSNALSFLAWFTTVFSGGLLPWYILVTKYYGLQNNLFALFIPTGMNVFYMFILRNNFKAVPQELLEAAQIDGASHSRTFFTIVLPLSKVGMVTIILFTVLQYWNDFHLSLYLITKSELYTVQKLLQNMMANISALLSGAAGNVERFVQIPSNTARMAMTMLTIIPVLIFYPFAQKYFVKGMTVGAVKG